jgi:periplasmic protein TonB
MSSATMPSHFDAASFDPYRNTVSTRVRAGKPKGLDKRRIAAIAITVCAHVLVVGVMLLPPPQYLPTEKPDSVTEVLVFEQEVKKEPPPKAEPIKIVREIEPRPQISTPVQTPAAAPSALSEPLAEAVTDAPSALLGAPIAASVPTTAVISSSPVSEALALLQAPPPRYPPAELKRGIQGTVHFKVRVGVDGRVRDIEIIKTSGSRGLDRAAILQIKRRWIFEPRLFNGEKIESTGIGTLSFSLE